MPLVHLVPVVLCKTFCACFCCKNVVHSNVTLHKHVYWAPAPGADAMRSTAALTGGRFARPCSASRAAAPLARRLQTTRIQCSTSSSDSLQQLLQSAGVSQRDVGRCISSCPELPESAKATAPALVQHLRELGLSSTDIAKVITRYPQVTQGTARGRSHCGQLCGAGGQDAHMHDPVVALATRPGADCSAGPAAGCHDLLD